MQIPWNTDRLRAQSGFFTFHPDDMPLDRAFPKYVRRVDIPDEAIGGARMFLVHGGPRSTQSFQTLWACQHSCATDTAYDISSAVHPVVQRDCLLKTVNSALGQHTSEANMPARKPDETSKLAVRNPVMRTTTGGWGRCGAKPPAG